MAIAKIVGSTSVGKAFDKGFKLYKENFTTVFVAALIAAVIGGLTCGICGPVMTCGLFAIILTLVRGGETKPTIGEVFSKFNLFLTSLVTAIVIGLLFGLINAALMFVPVVGIIANYAISCIISPAVMCWAYLSIVDRKATIGEAIGSLKLTMEKPFWLFVLVSFVASLIGCIGLIACGIGILFTMPLASCIIVAAYNDMAGGEETAAIDTQATVAAEEAPPTDAQ